MSVHRSSRNIRDLIASLLMMGLIVVTMWTVQLRPSTVRAASSTLVQVTNFGTNPTGLQMWLYVPPSVKPHPAILLALHYCTGSGPIFFSNTEFANLADQNGFIVIYPSAPRSGQCWDVSSPQSLTRNGGSDPVGLMSMVSYVEQQDNGDPNNIFVTGASSGAMMTDVLLAEYPDVFKAGAAFMGVPYHCFATTDGSLWNSACANGQITMTPQQWGDLVRAAFPGYNGPRPRVQLWHGTADTTLNYANFGEEIKQWTNVLNVSQAPSFTDSPQSGWTRTLYGGSGIGTPVEGISIQGTGHVLPLSGMAAYAIQFMGLDMTVSSTPTPTSGITPTPTSGSGVCKVSYAVNQWSGGFTANLTLTNTSDSTINGWKLQFTFPAGQQVTQGWNGVFSQAGANVMVTNESFNATLAVGASVNPGFNGSWSGSNPSPTAFTLNGASCSIA